MQSKIQPVADLYDRGLVHEMTPQEGCRPLALRDAAQPGSRAWIRRAVPATLLLPVLFMCGPIGCATSAVPRVSVTPDHTQPIQHTENQTTSLALSVEEQDEGVLAISARRVTMCQAVEQRPMKQTTTVERSLEGSALAWTILGAVVSATATAAGIVSLAAPCALGGDQQCEPAQARALGGVMLGVGGATLIPVIIAGVSAMDSTEESAGPAKVVMVGEPSACNVEPAAGIALAVTSDVDSHYRGEATTDENGKAEVTLEGLNWKPRSESTLIEVVTVGRNKERASATLTAASLKAYRRFSADYDAEHKARLEQARAARKARTIADLRASALDKSERLHQAEKQLRALGPPWNEEKLKAAAAAEEVFQALKPTVEELALLTPDERADFLLAAQRFGDHEKRIAPSVQEYAARVQKKQEEAAAAYRASPEGIAAARRSRCESKCREFQSKCSNACNDGQCRQVCSAEESRCDAGCQ